MLRIFDEKLITDTNLLLELRETNPQIMLLFIDSCYVI